MNVANNVKRWFVETVAAESWEGKPLGPNITLDSLEMTSLDEARGFVQKKIGEFASNPTVRLEWIDWAAKKVQINFNYSIGEIDKVQQTYVMYIVEVDEDGKLTHVDIGD